MGLLKLLEGIARSKLYRYPRAFLGIFFALVVLVVCVAGSVCIVVAYSYLAYQMHRESYIVFNAESQLALIIANGPFQVVALVAIAVYTLRWIHFKIEKSRLNDTNIKGGYNSVVTIFNLEGRAERFRGGAALDIIENGDHEYHGEELGIVGGEPKKVLEYERPFIARWFCVWVGAFTSLIFRKMKPEAPEDDEEDEKVKKTNVIVKWFLVVRDLVTGVIMLMGSTSDAVVIVYWAVSCGIYVYNLLGESRSEPTYLFHSIFFFLSIGTIIVIGYHIAVFASVFNYFDYTKRFYAQYIAPRLRARKDSESESDSEDGESLSTTEKVLFGIATIVLLPIFLLGRMVNMDILSHLLTSVLNAFRSSEKPRHNERIYPQQIFFWSIGKALPMLYIQVMSTGFSFVYLAAYVFTTYREQNAAVDFTVAVVVGCISFCFAFSSAVQNSLFWNSKHYEFRNLACRLNYILHQSSCLLVRLSAVLCSVLLSGLLIVYGGLKGDTVLYAMTMYTCLAHFFILFMVSFVMRLHFFFFLEVVHSIKTVRVPYIPWNAMQVDIFLEAFSGSFGGIINANPSSTFIIQLVFNVFEGCFLSLFNSFWSFIFISNLVNYSSDSSISGEFSEIVFLDYAYNIVAQFLVYCMYVYIVTAIVHFILFPVCRNKPMSFHT